MKHDIPLVIPSIAMNDDGRPDGSPRAIPWSERLVAIIAITPGREMMHCAMKIISDESSMNPMIVPMLFHPRL